MRVSTSEELATKREGPGNNRRYERHGFVKSGSFELGEGGPSVTQMWREPRLR